MAAMRSGVTPGYLARCFLRQAGKPNRSSTALSGIWSYRLLQRSHLHTVFECRSPVTRTLLGRRHHGKFLWVNAVAVRHNSSQIPPDDGSLAAPVVEAPGSLSVLESSPVSLPINPTPNFAQQITEQIPVETVYMAASIADSSAPPPVIERVADAAPMAEEVLQAVTTEPTLAELGLVGHTPVGLIQSLLEFIHLDLNLPWWGAIVVGTVLARMALFPVIVMAQREGVKMSNAMPEITKLSNRMTEAKESGNKFEFAKAQSDLKLLQKKHDISPLRTYMAPFLQAPIFISFFIALRKMAYLPVPSLQTGGLLWFPDLTAADPFYIMPVAVAVSMFLVIKMNAEFGIENPTQRAVKNVLKVMPFAILPFTFDMPTAVFTYWLSSNCFSICQVTLLQNPWVKTWLRIPERIKHPNNLLPQNEGFITSLKKGWHNAQLAQQLQEREKRINNHLDFAAKGPLKQTFTHNPLQQKPTIAAASAKDKSLGKAKPWKDTVI